MLIQYLELLDQTTAKTMEQLTEHLQRAREKTNLITNLIASQQKYAGLIGTKEHIKIQTVIADAVNILESTLKKNNIVIMREGEEDLTVIGDKTKLIHILINLITNAAEAMQQTIPQKRIILFTTGRQAGRSCIKITDTGQGMESATLKNLFQLGFSTKHTGHGFGLHSCAHYMQEMGGSIQAESEGAGKGASFILQFPQV